MKEITKIESKNSYKETYVLRDDKVPSFSGDLKMEHFDYDPDSPNACT